MPVSTKDPGPANGPASLDPWTRACLAGLHSADFATPQDRLPPRQHEITTRLGQEVVLHQRGLALKEQARDLARAAFDLRYEIGCFVNDVVDQGLLDLYGCQTPEGLLGELWQALWPSDKG